MGKTWDKAEAIINKLPQMSDKNAKKIEKGCTDALKKIGKDESNPDMLVKIYRLRGEAFGRLEKGDKARADFDKAESYKPQEIQKTSSAPKPVKQPSSSDSDKSSSPKRENIVPELKANNAGSGTGFAEQVAAQKDPLASLSPAQRAAFERLKGHVQEIKVLDERIAESEKKQADYLHRAAIATADSFDQTAKEFDRVNKRHQQNAAKVFSK